MIKYFGLIFIMAACVLTGVNMTLSLTQRVKVLMSFKAVFQQFKLDISYSMINIKELLSNDMNSCFPNTAESIVKNLESGLTLKESADKAINNSSFYNVLKTEEREFIIDVLSQLGICDADGQFSLLDNAIEKISYYIENALEDKRKNSKIYLTSAIYFGALVVIILL